MNECKIVTERYLFVTLMPVFTRGSSLVFWNTDFVFNV